MIGLVSFATAINLCILVLHYMAATHKEDNHVSSKKMVRK